MRQRRKGRSDLRCKQPRLIVDTKTPPDSKWLPRIGDWICTGCTNNNYASREKCKKCGQPKEVAAMPAMAIPGTFVRVQGQGGLQQSMNVGVVAPIWPLGGSNASSINPFSALPKGWRNGDWLCNCGFHNYSSRTECKKCNATPPALGIKRLASDDLVHDWDKKRLNAGPATNQYLQSYPGFEQLSGSISNPQAGIYAPYPSEGSAMAPNVQLYMRLPQLATVPTLIGKGAKQWRDGDWMCTNCNNHNYASRSECYRCKTQRIAIPQAIGVA
ncbi:hypothetical protein Nepgr_008377 [Nepenthes gracilis]|uniref:RanBP2-type domain-containing protein n=1 Tax=Nepenthes gracilis TaxID=150966 RepID=A0AAD3XJ62_NEPGR|nr:hypothetical protein Nepgr_008377 [Nepenthes gracilis]